MKSTCFAIFMFLLFSSSVIACSCGQYFDFKAMSVYHITQSQLAFKGEIIAKETVGEVGSLKYKYTFKVLENIKPVVTQKELVIYSHKQSSMCGVNYEIGEIIYIFSNKDKVNNQFQTTDCSNNFSLKYYANSPKRIKGIQQVIKDYKNSNHGTKWHDENGVLVAIGTVRNGNMEGLWTFYYTDGNLAQQGFCVKGQKEGNWAMYLTKKESTSKLTRLDKKQKKLVRNPENILYCIATCENNLETSRKYVY